MKSRYAILGCALTAALALSACATPPKGLSLSDIATASIPELQAADANAKAVSDSIASQCYEGAIQVAQSQVTTTSTGPTLTVTGPVTLFQDVRDGVKVAESGKDTVDTYLRLFEQPCGPLIADVQLDVAKAAKDLVILGVKVPKF